MNGKIVLALAIVALAASADAYSFSGKGRRFTQPLQQESWSQEHFSSKGGYQAPLVQEAHLESAKGGYQQSFTQEPIRQVQTVAAAPVQTSYIQESAKSAPLQVEQPIYQSKGALRQAPLMQEARVESYKGGFQQSFTQEPIRQVQTVAAAPLQTSYIQESAKSGSWNMPTKGAYQAPLMQEARLESSKGGYQQSFTQEPIRHVQAVASAPLQTSYIQESAKSAPLQVENSQPIYQSKGGFRQAPLMQEARLESYKGGFQQSFTQEPIRQVQTVASAPLQVEQPIYQSKGAFRQAPLMQEARLESSKGHFSQEALRQVPLQTVQVAAAPAIVQEAAPIVQSSPKL